MTGNRRGPLSHPSKRTVRIRSRSLDTVVSLHREDVVHDGVAVNSSQRMGNRHLGSELQEKRAWHPQAAQVAALLT